MLALMLQPMATLRHVNYHETTAALCTYVAGVQVDLSSHSGLYRIVQTYVLCTPVCVHMVHEPQLLYSQHHKYIRTYLAANTVQHSVALCPVL